MYISGTGINSFGCKFFSEQKLEDAGFTTYSPISKEEIEASEEKYNLTLEDQKILNIEENDTTARIFSVTEKTNLYDITKGNDLKSDSDIIISEGYALNMSVEIGDKITLNGNVFTVCGYFQRPDYLYMIENETDSYKNISTFFLGYVTDNAIEKLGAPTERYSIIYNEDNSIEFRREIQEKYIMQSYMSAEENPRVTLVTEQGDLFLMMAYIFLFVLPLIAVILVSIIISRKVKEEQKLIGTLSAFGYTKWQIMAHYAGFGAIPGLFGGCISFIITEIFAQSYGELCLMDYEPMHINFSLPISVGLLGIIVPTAMYILTSVIAVNRLLKADIVAMLTGKAGGKEKMKKTLRNTRVSFKTKLAVRNLIGNPARAFAVLTGIFLGSYIMLLSFSMIDSVENVSDTALSSMGTYKYQYVLNSLETEPTINGSKMTVNSLEASDGTRITFMGLEKDNPYISLKNDKGKEIKIDDKYYLSNTAATLYDIEAGDKMTFLNPMTMEEITIEISDIINYEIGMNVFTSLENMNKLMGLENDVYNAVMSDRELDIPDEKIMQIIDADSIAEQCDTIMNEMGVMIYSIVILGIVICIAAIYVVVNMMVTENRSNISMLKVLGYEDNKISRIVLSANHILLPIGIILSIPATLATTGGLFKWMLNYIGLLIEPHITPVSYIYTIVFTSACYFGSVWFVGRKTKKVSMVEALKDNRE